MEQNKRLRYFDMARGIGALLVVIGHIERFPVPFRVWIFSFHMPLFFIISGMLLNFKKEYEKPFPLILKRRLKGVMIPYACFSLMYLSIVLHALLIAKTIQPGTLWINVFYVVSLYGMNVLWFLPALVLGELLFIFILKQFSAKMAAVVTVVLTVLAFFASLGLKSMMLLYGSSTFISCLNDFLTVLLRAVFAASFMCIGYFVFFLLRHDGKLNILELLAGIVLFIINIPLAKVLDGVDMRSLAFSHNIFLYYACAVAGSLGIILICKNMKPIKLLEYYGQNSLVTMAVHNNRVILTYATLAAFQVNLYVTRARDYVFCAVVFVIIMIYVTIMIEIFNRLFPFLLGKPWNNPFKLKKDAAS